MDSPPSYLPLPDSLTPCLTPSLFSLSLSLSLTVSYSLTLTSASLLTAGGEASGLQPSGIDLPTLFPLLSPPSLGASPSCMQAFGMREASPLTGLWQQRSLRLAESV